MILLSVSVGNESESEFYIFGSERSLRSANVVYLSVLSCYALMVSKVFIRASREPQESFKRRASRASRELQES